MRDASGGVGFSWREHLHSRMALWITHVTCSQNGEGREWSLISARRCTAYQAPRRARTGLGGLLHHTGHAGRGCRPLLPEPHCLLPREQVLTSYVLRSRTIPALILGFPVYSGPYIWATFTPFVALHEGARSSSALLAPSGPAIQKPLRCTAEPSTLHTGVAMSCPCLRG